MADYGAMLTYPDGSPFYIRGTLPLAFLRKRTVNIANPSSGAQYAIDLDSNAGRPYTYFFNTDTDVSWAKMTAVSGRYQITCGSNVSNRSFNITIYTFGFEAPSLPPNGIAIWDENRNLVITHETRVLQGLNRAGNNGTEQAGINVNTTLSGKKAIAPAICGFLNGRIEVVPPQPWGMAASFGCYYNGSTTRIYGAPEGQLPGTIISTSNTREAPLYIDCSLYD